MNVCTSVCINAESTGAAVGPWQVALAGEHELGWRCLENTAWDVTGLCRALSHLSAVVSWTSSMSMIVDRLWVWACSSAVGT